MYTSDTQSLLSCRQKENETLHSYVARFNKAMLSVPERADNMITAAFTYGLCPGLLFKKLIGKPPKYRKDLLERVHQFMKQETTQLEKSKKEEKRIMLVA